MAWWRSFLPGTVAAQHSAQEPLLTAADRARLDYLRLQTGVFLALTRDGTRIGPRPGGMVEFHGHQTYVPGMDIRGLDWSVYARNRQWMVRQYTREVAAHIHLYVDASASMAFDLIAQAGQKARPTTKYRQAARLAAMIACIALQGQDRVSLYIARAPGDQPDLLSLRGASGMAQLPAVLNLLDSVTPAGAVRDRDMIRSILSTRPERGLFVWITDGLDSELLQPVAEGVSSDGRSRLEETLGWIGQAVGRPWLVQVQSERDWWAEGGRLELIDAENGRAQELNLSGRAKEQFRQAAAEHAGLLEKAVRAYGGQYLAVHDHADPFDCLYRALGG